MSDYDELLREDEQDQPSPQRSVYDDLIQQDAQADEGRLRGSMKVALETTPDRAADVRRLSARFGLPETVVDRQYDSIRTRAVSDDALQATQDTPAVATWLREPRNAAVASDDLPALTTLEHVVGFGLDATRALMAGGYRGATTGLWGLIQGAAEAVGAESAAVYAARVRKASEATTAAVRGQQQPRGFVAGAALSGVESVGANITGLMASLATGSPAPMLTIMGAQVGGEAYGQARDRGVTPRQAAVFAVGQGGVEVATEMIPASRLIKDLAGNQQFIKMLTGQLAAEIPGEQVATLLQDLNEWAVQYPARPFGDYLAERPSAMAETLIATVVATATQASVGRATERLMRHVGEVATESKTAKRSPEATQALVASIVADSPIETAHFDTPTWVSYWQSQGVDPAQKAAELTGSLESLPNAIAAGTPLAVPMAAYIAQVAPTEHHGALSQELRIGPDDWNAKETAAFHEKHSVETPADEQTAAIQQALVSKLTAAGMTAGAAEASAQQMVQVFATRAQRAGLDPVELFNRYGLEIQRPDLVAPRGEGDETGSGESRLADRAGRDQRYRVPSRLEGASETARAEQFEALYSATLEAARALDPGVDAERIRQELDARVGLYLDATVLAAEDRARPHDLLRAIAAAGGLSAEAEDAGGLAGELKAMQGRFGSLGGVPGVFRRKKRATTGNQRSSGYGVDEMLERLHQDHRWRWIENTDMLLDQLDDLSRRTEAETGDVRLPGTEERRDLGVKLETRWWDADAYDPSLFQRAADPTATPEFRAWFGESVVADAGRPRVVYHSGDFDPAVDPVIQVGLHGMHFGTRAAAEERPYGKAVDDFIREAEIDQDAGRWYWSSQGQESYGTNEEGFETRAEAVKDLEAAAIEYANGIIQDSDPPVIVPVYLSIQNPKRLTDQGAQWDAAIEQAKAEGYDGIVYRNEYEDKGQDSYIIFAPWQAKHAEANRGTYDRRDPSVLFQETPKPPATEDRLDTGETQPRLPGAEEVRETEQATPPLEAPFSLTPPPSAPPNLKKLQRTLFQDLVSGGSAPAASSVRPTFYSRILATVQQSPQTKATGAQWIATIRNSKLGINLDEFALTRVSDLAAGHVYTKNEVLQYLATHEIRLTERVLGENTGRRDRWVEIRADELAMEWADAQIDRWDDGGFYVAEVEDDDGEPAFAVRHSEGGSDGELYATEEEAQAEADRANDAMQDERHRELVDDYAQEATEQAEAEYEEKFGSDEPQFDEWVLSGPADAYREAFVLAPPTKGDASVADALTEAREEAASFRRLAYDLEAKIHITEPGPEQDSAIEAYQEARAAALNAAEREALLQQQYEGASWADGHEQYDGIENPIVRLRFNRRRLRFDDGTETMAMFLEEVQPPREDNQAAMPPLYRKNWREIGLKWALRYAADHGLGAVAWTTGSEQVERYSLKKHVREIRWTTDETGAVRRVVIDLGLHDERRIEVGEDAVIRKGEWEGEKIHAVVGGEIAGQIVAEQRGALSGDGLRVGGEGLERLYDKDLPAVIQKLPAVKRAGVRVEPARLMPQRGTYSVVAASHTVARADRFILERKIADDAYEQVGEFPSEFAAQSRASFLGIKATEARIVDRGVQVVQAWDLRFGESELFVVGGFESQAEAVAARDALNKHEFWISEQQSNNKTVYRLYMSDWTGAKAFSTREEAEQAATAWRQQSIRQSIRITPALADHVQGGQTLFQSYTGPMVVQHNITPEKLRKAARMGGLAAPSLAIARADDPLVNFGAITLLGSPAMVRPSRDTKVFAADAYTPRYPTVHYKISREAQQQLSVQLEPFNELMEVKYFDLDSLVKEGPNYLRTEPRVMAAFLEGRAQLDRQAVNTEKGKAAQDHTRHFYAERELQRVIREKRLDSEYEAFVEEMFGRLGATEQIFRGFTHQGNRSYTPHTLEHAVKEIKKELRGRETAGNIFGVGQLRAAFTPQFRTLEGIKRERGRLATGAEFEAVKQEAEAELFAVGDALAPYYSHERGFRYIDTVIALIEDSARIGFEQAARDYDFRGVPQDVRAQLAEFVTHLRNLPTEYFEAKLIRGVPLNEFKGAVVPKGTPADVRRLLTEAGVPITTYDPAVAGDRERVIRETAETTGGLFQDKQQTGKRGAITFTTTGSGEQQTLIRLFENADLSTFLHESAHLYLKLLEDLAEAGDAESQRDLAALRQAWGWGDTIGVAEHEQFAEAYEAYLLEGRAPSVELRSAFAQFRAWLISIYQALTTLNVRLSDDVRNVFNRLLATDAQLAQAQQVGPRPLFATPEQAGMTPTAFDAYARSTAAAGEAARRALEQRLLDDVAREQRRIYREAQARIRKEVTDEANAMPVYQAWSVMSRGRYPDGETAGSGAPMRLNRRAAVEQYGIERVRALPKGVVSDTGEQSADEMADMFGFGSGDALLTALSTAETKQAYIRRETQARTLEQAGSPLLDGTAYDNAREALATREHASVVEAELRHLARIKRQAGPLVREARAQGDARIAALRVASRAGAARTRAAVPSREALRQVAAAQIARTRIRALKPHHYLSAATQASQQAYEAVGRQEWDAAIAAKQQELLNLALFNEARRVLEDVERRVRAAQALNQPASRRRLGLAGQSYLDQVDGILDRYSFARVSDAALERREALADWIGQQEAEGQFVDLPPVLLAEQRRTPYRDLSVEELIGVTDGLQQIARLARLKNRLLTAAKSRELAQVVSDLAKSIREHFKGRRRDTSIETRLPENNARRALSGFFASHRKMASLAREMDGFQEGGPMWDAVIRRLNVAGDREAEMNAIAITALDGLIKQTFPGRAAADLYTRSTVAGRPLTKMARIMVALNWGNEGNRQRIRDGYDWTDAQVQQVLDSLDSRDWTFVNGVFALINSYWSDIEAKQRRVTGLAPEKVEAAPITAAHGSSPGGYFPLKYDDRQSARAAGYVELETSKLQGLAAYTHATTKRGHTKARQARVKEPVRLDFGVITEHLQQVIHDLSHHEALIDVGKVLGAREVQNAIYETYGDIVYRQFKDGVKDVAFGTMPATNWWEASLNHVRAGATIAGLGWNLTTSFLQPLGLTQSIVRIGPWAVGRGLYRWLRSPRAFIETPTWINEQSTFMRTRSRTQQREINEIRNQVGLNTGRVQGWVDEVLRTTTLDRVNYVDVADSYFWLIQQMQRVADVPTWLGAYEAAMTRGEDESRAVALADQAVIDAQGSGQIKDLAAVQRGGPALRVWTTFYSFFSTTYNQAAETRRSGKSVGRKAADYLMLWTVPATLGYLMREALRPGDDDEQDLVVRLLRENLAYMSGMLLGFRELTGAIQGYSGYEGPAGARGFANAGRLVKQVQQGEADAAFWRALNDTAGVLLHYPAGQVRRTIEGAAALIEGKTANPLALVTGAPQE